MILDEMKSKTLLTRAEAAFYIGVSLPTLDKVMKKDGFNATVRIGEHRVFIHREKLDQWIESRTGN